MIAYLSGPISGHPDGNRPAFDLYERLLRDAGYEVVNPHRVFTEPLPADPAQKRAHWQRAMRADLRALMDCDLIALIPGWAASEGARWEFETAARLGMQTLFLLEDLA